MAFLDDINKKISQAGQKAKDFSDTSRINSLIAEEERKINAFYLQVGKLYVSLHSNDYESAFEGFMASIADSEEKLKKYRSDLQIIKGVKKCPQCNGDVALNSAFCPTCGFHMPRTSEENNLTKCVSCGQFIPNNLRFCTYCGKPVNAVPVVETPIPYQQPPVIAAPVQNPVYAQPNNTTEPAENIQAPAVPEAADQPVAQQNNIFCTQCGFSLPADSAFCTECGSKVIS